MLFGEHATCQAEAEYPELWKGLVGDWSPCLSPRGGTVLRNLSGRGNHGTLTNMDPETDWVVSGGNGAIDFDGTNDYIALSSGQLSSTSGGDWTIVCSLNTRTQNSFSGVVTFNGDGLTFFSGPLCILVSNTVVWGTASTQSNIGQWRHYVATRRGSSYALYVDGVNSSQVRSDSGYGLTGAYYLGRGYSGQVYNGLMDDVRIYNFAWPQWLVSLDKRLGRGGWATPRRRRWNYATAQTAIPYWVFARKNARLIGGGIT